MKRLLSSVLFASMLIVGAGQAQAALLTDWSYTVNDAYFTGGATNLEWEGQLTTGVLTVDPAGSTGNMVQGAISLNSGLIDAITHTLDLLSSPSNTPFQNEDLITTLYLDYNVASAGGELDINALSYMNLYYYNDGNGNEFVYVPSITTTVTGKTEHDGYAYTLSGVTLFVDDRTMGTDESGTAGWVINEDTIYNVYKEYDQYNPDGNIYLGEKVTAGVFDIDFSFSLGAHETTPNAPTPEPATMLLMGAGLAGLGFVKRRRQA